MQKQISKSDAKNLTAQAEIAAAQIENLPETKSVNHRRAGLVWEARLLWLLVFILLGYWTHGWISRKIDPELRRQVLQILRDRYPQHLITIDSAHLLESEAIVIDGLRITLPTATGKADIVRIGRVTAFGKISLLDLASSHIQIDLVTLDDCSISMWPVRDDLWSLQMLSNAGPLPADLPPIFVRSGILKIRKDARSGNEIIFHDLKARFRVNRDPSMADRPYEFQARLKGNFFRSIDVYANVSRDKSDWALRGSVDHCVLSDELTDRLPDQFSQPLKNQSGLQGTVSSSFTCQQPRGENFSFEINGEITDGKLVHPRLPYPLERLNGRLYSRNDMLQLRDATASSGQANFKLNADVYGMSKTVPIVVEMQITSLPLDDRLYRVLSPKLQNAWQQLRLKGLADARVRFEYDGARWRPNIEADVHEGSIVYANFPYQVSQIEGRFLLDEKSLHCEKATGVAGGANIDLEIHLQKIEDFTAYDVRFHCDRPVKIDDQLVNALTPLGQATSEGERFVRSLRPTGQVLIRQGRFWRTDASGEASKLIDLQFQQAGIAYELFQYPVFNINGEVSIRDSLVNIDSLSGQNDSAIIHCRGQSTCENKNCDALNLEFDAYSIPLEEELHLALPQGTRQLWDAIQPSGVIDHVVIKVIQTKVDGPVDLAVTIEEQGNFGTSSSKSVTVRPKEIPYPLTDISCRIAYRNGIAEINQFSGHHDVSFVTAQGQFFAAQDGSWNGTVDWLPQTRVIVDQSLLTSLPGYIQQPILNTAFRGPVGVMGKTSFSSSKDGNSLTVRDWDLELAIEDGRLGWGQIASGIRGSVLVQGTYDEQEIFAQGQLQLDSLMVYQVPVLNLDGPFAIVQGEILLGRTSIEAIKKQNSIRPALATRNVSFQRETTSVGTTQTKLTLESKPLIAETSTRNNPHAPNFLRAAEDPQLAINVDDISASCLGGQVHLHGSHEILSGRSKLNMQLQEADLREAFMDLSQNANAISGKAWVEMSIQGSLFNYQTLTGSGQASLRRADLVQLPIMTRLFRVLSIKDSQGGAFESGEIRFRIDGDRIPIDNFTLDGDIISLRGNGWLNLRRELHLDLLSYVGKRSIMAALLGPIVSNNDNASLLAVEVDGTLDAMEFRQSLALMNANAAQLFPERF